MKSAFRAAYATRLGRLADQMIACLTAEDGHGVVTANRDLWAALEADVRAGLLADSGRESLVGTLLTRARTVAETSGGGEEVFAFLPVLIALNQQTAMALVGAEPQA